MSISVRPAFACALAILLTVPLLADTRGDDGAPGTAIAGQVLDSSGAAVPGVSVALRVAGSRPLETVTDAGGQFTFAEVPAGPVRLLASLGGFAPATLEIPTSAARLAIRIVLQPQSVTEQVTVRGEGRALQTVSAVKTPIPLRDIPQAASVVTRDTIAAQGMQNLADLVRYVPGVAMAQGEGNRDAAIFRGNNSTADFFVDGVRDDVQYYRDLYNVERVEVLKGANAMTFGRGGAGGVLNRVTREATWTPVREFTVQAGTFDNRRATMDVGQAITRRVAGRITGVYENSRSYRDDVDLERYGLNPSVAATLGTHTVLTLAYEHFHDARTADRGIPSYRGRPLAADPSAFFGDPAASRSRANVNAFSATLHHDLGGDFVLRNHTRFADYDKFYQNVYPASVSADGAQVSLSAYNNATTRHNVFNQTDVTGSLKTGRVRHSFLLGGELGRQATDNLRHTGYFGPSNATSVLVPITAPSASIPATYRQSATDADNSGDADVAAVYVQDQAELARWLRVVAGVRFESFEVTFHNNRTLADFRSRRSPRLSPLRRHRQAGAVDVVLRVTASRTHHAPASSSPR